jgi:hypothetical protein
MGCKRARRASAGEIEKAMMSEGFAGPLGNGLPCGFRKRITMGGNGMPAAHLHEGAGKSSDVQTMLFQENETPGVSCRGRERGRRRTRQDQIPPTKKSPVKLRTSSGPHRTKKICFSSAGPAWIGASAFPKFDPAV